LDKAHIICSQRPPPDDKYTFRTSDVCEAKVVNCAKR